ncbi:MAG: anthranilate synthase component II, partial [Spirochaetota bacterium]
MILLIDNYDSFTFNIFQYLKEVSEQEVMVARNDCITTGEIDELQPDMLIAGPGPGRPAEAGRLVEILLHCMPKMPVLGICLGHQAIVHALGGNIVPARHIVHGKSERIRLNGKGVFRAMPSAAVFTRYHSLAAEAASLPEELEISARSEDGEMARDLGEKIADIAEEISSMSGADMRLDVVARREPGGIGFSHPIANDARAIMEHLGIHPRVSPSTSEFSAFIDRKIPAMTIGLTHGEHLNEENETIEIEPIARGLAQLIGILTAIDKGIVSWT